MKKIKAASSCFTIMTLFLMAGWVSAATFLVDNLEDTDDSNPYMGVFA